MTMNQDTASILKNTSRTFYIPIMQLPEPLCTTVASAYLCMRAIDEIEDHPGLDPQTKAKWLRMISFRLQEGRAETKVHDWMLPQDQQALLPEVTVRLAEWCLMPPLSIAPRIWDATSAMADRMANWAERNWHIATPEDLDAYTFSVAGAVGLLLADIWSWYDQTDSSRELAVGFGRGLQTVNILRNDQEDRQRGVSFYPKNWTRDHMFAYARKNLQAGQLYLESLPPGPAHNFCRIPLKLAQATLRIMTLGRPKLTREEVEKIVDPNQPGD